MHISVLLEEAIKALNIKEDGFYIDATLGYAGHSCSILKKINKGYLISFDQDSQAIKASSQKLSSIANNFTIIHSNFRYIKEEVEKLGINKVDGILFDLGTSSMQLDTIDRGFNYHEEAFLDMRMDQDASLSAFDVVNTYEEKDLANILRKYADEKYASSIARNIVKQREKDFIKTTTELAEIVKASVPYKYRENKHPARKTFQAIRIEVNDEYNALEEGLTKALELLKVGGRIVVISFHSGEDRIVKNIFKKYTEAPEIVKGLPNIDSSYLPDYKLINKKIITPSTEEVDENKRSRSAKMRVIERVK